LEFSLCLVSICVAAVSPTTNPSATAPTRPETKGLNRKEHKERKGGASAGNVLTTWVTLLKYEWPHEGEHSEP